MGAAQCDTHTDAAVGGVRSPLSSRQTHRLMSAVLSWANCVNEIQHIKARVEEKRRKKIKGTQRHVGIWADSPARY